jgi:hypothetical protein
MEEKTQQLQTSVSEILKQLNLPSPSQGILSPSQSTTSPGEQPVCFPLGTRYLPTMTMTRDSTPDLSVDGPSDKEVFGTAPMTSLWEVTKLRNLRSHPENRTENRKSSTLQEDFISRGLLDLHSADELFKKFKVSLNQYLWGGIALVHDSLRAVRKSSSILLTSIIAVTALHISGSEEIFDLAYSEFLALASTSMFDQDHNLDDIRGFCLGAFWLSSVSCMFSAAH